MADIFLSYAQEDVERVRQIAQALSAAGWDVWWDRTLAPGVRFRSEIAKQLNAAKCVVVLWSAQAVESDWVLDEAEDAKQRGVLVQAVLDDVKPPHGFRQIHWGSLTRWSGKADAAELIDLRAGIERHATPAGRPALRGTAGASRRRADRRKVFLCYRDDSTNAETGRLLDDLVDAFDSDSFLADVDILPPADSHDYIAELRTGSAVMIVVIGRSWVTPSWSTVPAESKPYESMRAAIARALAGNLPVIPLLVQDAPMPQEDQMPDGLQELTRRNAILLSNRFWHEGVEQLVKTLKRFLSSASEPSEP